MSNDEFERRALEIIHILQDVSNELEQLYRAHELTKKTTEHMQNRIDELEDKLHDATATTEL